MFVRKNHALARIEQENKELMDKIRQQIGKDIESGIAKGKVHVYVEIPDRITEKMRDELVAELKEAGWTIVVGLARLATTLDIS